MQFIYDGEFYKVIRITGPSHNLLGVSFGDNENNSLDIEAFQLNGGEIEPIFEKSVKKQVLLGVSEANEEFDTNYQIKRIQFVSTDTFSDEVYKKLIKELIKYIESNGEFKSV